MKRSYCILLCYGLLVFHTRGPANAQQQPTRQSTPIPQTPMRAVDDGWKASWSPDGVRLIYCTLAGDSIRMFDLRTLTSLELVQGGAGIVKDASWSPDGKSIAFVKAPAMDDYEKEEVWVVGADGQQARLVSPGGYPAWSADSKQLYFHSRTTNRLMSIVATMPNQDPVVIMDPSPSWYPAISPDGKLVAAAQPGKLFVLEIATGKSVAECPLGQSRGVLPSWSPDGKWVTYGGFDDDPMGIWILDVQNKKASLVTKGPFTMPAWSSNGEKLAFDLRLDGRRQVWMVSRVWVDNQLRDQPQLREQPRIAAPVKPKKPSGQL